MRKFYLITLVIISLATVSKTASAVPISDGTQFEIDQTFYEQFLSNSTYNAFMTTNFTNANGFEISFAEFWSYVQDNLGGNVTISANVSSGTNDDGVPTVIYASNVNNTDLEAGEFIIESEVDYLDQLFQSVASEASKTNMWTIAEIVVDPTNDNGVDTKTITFYADYAGAEVPIDGGLSLLALGGITFGIIRMRKTNA